jgi:4-hydroxy 2-oxovalerate aldolase
MIDFDLVLLDCTLRDGGHALEDMKLRGLGSKFFNKERREGILKNLIASKIEVIELGSVSDGLTRQDEFSNYTGVQDVSDIYQDFIDDCHEYAIIYRDPHIYNLDIPDWRTGLPRIARVIIRYSDLNKSFDFCRLLANKGYLVFIQPMATIQYSSFELDNLAYLANEISAGALYIVDTYGAMSQVDIRRIFSHFDQILGLGIKIGLHAHDNLNLAYSNTLDFLSINSSRDRIIDSTLYGMGLGAGNCRSEIICWYLNSKRGKNYVIEELLSGCEVIESISGKDQSWGVGLVNTLPALEGVATKYVHSLRYDCELSYSEIYKIIKSIPSDIRQQYSRENMNFVLKLNGLSL